MPFRNRIYKFILPIVPEFRTFWEKVKLVPGFEDAIKKVHVHQRCYENHLTTIVMKGVSYYTLCEDEH